MPRRVNSVENAVYDKELFTAATFGEIERVRQCLEAGSEVNARDGGGATALQMAAAGGHAEVARLLIDRGALVGTADHRGFTPLAYFVNRGDVATANLLLDLGADAKCRGCLGHSLLHDAVWSCYRKDADAGHALVRRLLDLGADPHLPNVAGVTPAEFARKIGRPLPLP